MTEQLEKEYELYLARIPLDCRSKVIDEDHGDADYHLLALAQRMSSWEGFLALELGLTSVEAEDINEMHRDPSKAKFDYSRS